jgi:Protein of unknown function (DUF3175)
MATTPKSKTKAKSKSETAKSKSGTGRVRAKAQPREKWSKRVMEHSDAMDLRAGVFKLKSASAIAKSLKKSSEASGRRRSSPFRSAMSMLNFEINRAGKNLSQERLQVLNQAKIELRKAFGRREP